MGTDRSVFSKRFHTFYIISSYIWIKRVIRMEKIGLIAIFVSTILVIAAVFSIYYFQDDEVKITTQVPLADDTNATAESVNTLVDSLNDFSFDFYSQIVKSEEGNIFFSPYSIFTAFSMAYEGARGNTSTQMQNVLNVLQNDSATLGSFGRIYNLLNQNQEGYEISTANAKRVTKLVPQMLFGLTKIMNSFRNILAYFKIFTWQKHMNLIFQKMWKLPK